MTTRVDEEQEQMSDIEKKIMDNNEGEKKRERKILDQECRSMAPNDSIKCNVS